MVTRVPPCPISYQAIVAERNAKKIQDVVSSPAPRLPKNRPNPPTSREESSGKKTIRRYIYN